MSQPTQKRVAEKKSKKKVDRTAVCGYRLCVNMNLNLRLSLIALRLGRAAVEV